MSTMLRSDIKRWVKEEFADAIRNEADRLLSDVTIDADDEIAIKEIRDRLLKSLEKR